MIEPELRDELEVLKVKLEQINKTLNPSRWQMLVQGLWRAVGYIVGLVIAVALLGWMLNLMGVVPALRDLSNDLQSILQDVRGR